MDFTFGNEGGAFQIDPSMTPDQLARKRARLAAMMPTGQAQSVGEGFGDLMRGAAIGVQNRGLDRFEQIKRQEAAGLFSGMGAQSGWGGQGWGAPPDRPTAFDRLAAAFGVKAGWGR